MPSLKKCFTPAAVRKTLFAATAGLALMGSSTAFAQEVDNTAPVAATTAAAGNGAAPGADNTQAAPPAVATTCVETTTTTRKSNGFLGLIGTSRQSTTTNTYNEECGRNRMAAMAASNFLNATNADGTPDYAQRALGIEIYRQSSPEIKAIIDQTLAERGTNIGEMTFVVENHNSPVVCTRATPAPGSTSASFACVRRAPPAASGATTGGDALVTAADAAARQPVTTATTATAAPAAPRP